MNNIFSYHRFLSLLRKDAADLRPKFIKILLISFGIGLIIFGFLNYNLRTNYEFGMSRFTILCIAVICYMIFAPFILYKRFNDRSAGVSYFMLPASQLEKWTVMFFYCVIVTPLLSLAALTFADLCLLPFYPLQGTTLWFLDGTVASVFSIMPFVTVTLYVLLFQSLFFLCNIWFQSRKGLKTVVVLIIISFAETLFSAMLIQLFPLSVADLTKVVENVGGSGFTFFIMHNLYNTVGLVQIVTLLLMGCMALGLWYASFLKLKEQEL